MNAAALMKRARRKSLAPPALELIDHQDGNLRPAPCDLFGDPRKDVQSLHRMRIHKSQVLRRNAAKSLSRRVRRVLRVTPLSHLVKAGLRWAFARFAILAHPTDSSSRSN